MKGQRVHTHVTMEVTTACDIIPLRWVKVIENIGPVPA